MRFAEPEILNGLWLIVPLVFLFWQLQRRKQMKIEKFAQPHLLRALTENSGPQNGSFRLAGLVFVFIFSLLALARPQWGFEWQEIRRRGIDILVAIDVSNSMLTADVRPSRLERTKLAVRDLVKKLEGDRIGLIAFAGEAFLVCPLTTDYSGFLLTLDELGTESVARGGTAVGEAIEEAMRSYEHSAAQYKAVIILTDGENLEGDPLKVAQEAKQRGLKLFTIGIGTREGELIQVEDQYGQKEFLKDAQGNFVKSRLNEELLQKIALMTDGAYVRASGAQFGLELIYDRELSKMEKREFDKKEEKRYYERFQIPLAIAFLFLVLDSFLVPRRSQKIVLLILFFFLPALSSSVWAAPLAKEMHEGNRWYKQMDYERAVQKFKAAYEKEPNSDIINFNLGTVLYRLRQYPEALEHLQKSLLTDSEELKAKAYFNLANTYYRLGITYEDKDIDRAIETLEKALEQVEKSLVINKDDKDAQYNRDFIKSEIRRLNRQKKEQPKTSQKQKQDGSGQEKKSPEISGGEQEKTGEESGEKDAEEDGGQEQREERGTAGGRDQQTGDQQRPAVSAGRPEKKILSQQEAERLLEQYKAGEEPSGMLNLQGKDFKEDPVLKDW